MTTTSTGYSPIPKNYDDHLSKREAEIVFGRRHPDPDLSNPYGTVNTKAYDSTDKLWTGSNGTIGLNPDPKLNKPLLDPRGEVGAVGSTDISDYVDPFAKHTRVQPEDWRATKSPVPELDTDWRHQALPRTTYTNVTGTIPAGATHSVAIKHDSGKTDWSLMPFEAVEEINKVLEFGAKKYAAHNWRTGTGFRYTRVLSSLLRHTFSWARGEDLDPESGLSHLAHMGCNVVFLIYYNKYKARYSNDDREKS
jgi:hypothetical protein